MVLEQKGLRSWLWIGLGSGFSSASYKLHDLGWANKLFEPAAFSFSFFFKS